MPALDPVARIGRLFSGLDAKAWRAVAATAALFALICAVFLVGKTTLWSEGTGAVEAWLAGFRDSPWALPLVILVFTATAFVGAPQFVLIAACVVAFGPWAGGVYSWVATIVSAAVTYGVGRAAGARTLERFGGRRLNRLAGYVGRNAFFASFAIRNLPSAPFIVVNMAFGVARASFLQFMAGCALGIVPKTVLVALIGGGFMTAVAGDGVWTSVILIGVGAAWFALMLGVRELLRRRGAIKVGPEADADET